jgi:hypothetical protein
MKIFLSMPLRMDIFLDWSKDFSTGIKCRYIQGRGFNEEENVMPHSDSVLVKT